MLKPEVVARSRRLYTLANDRVLDDLKGLVGSARHHNPFLPIFVIPYDDNIERTRDLCRINNINLIDSDFTAYDDMGRGFSRQFEKGMKIFRKFISFQDHDDLFLFLDADCLVLRNLTPLFDSFEHSSGDICFYAYSGPNRNFTEDDIKALAARRLGHREGLNAAFFMSLGRMLDRDLLSHLANRMLRLEKAYGLKHEQAFLNYCALVMSLDVRMMRTLAPLYSPPWNLNAKIIVKDGEYIFENTKQPPISVLHYSSAHWRDGINAELYRGFAGMAEQGVAVSSAPTSRT